MLEQLALSFMTPGEPKMSSIRACLCSAYATRDTYALHNSIVSRVVGWSGWLECPPAHPDSSRRQQLAVFDYYPTC